jgi:phage RecT family recombinase
MANDLILTTTQRLELPPPNNEGFAALAKVCTRLPQIVPSGVEAKPLLAAVLIEANDIRLRGCTPASVCRAAFNCVALGLPPGGFMGMAHFIPFKNECQLVVGYKGWTELAYDGGFLSDLHCEVVLRGEEFKRWTDEDGAHFRHTPDLDHDDRLEWEQVVSAYCVWHGTAGGKGFEIVGRKALDVLKRKGESKGKSVWATNPIAMALKTPILRASKTWKRTQRIAMASALDDAIEADLPQPSLLDSPLEVEPEKPRLEAFAEPLESPQADEATTIAQWCEEVGTLTTQGELDETKRTIPHTLTLHGQQTIMSAIEAQERKIAK